MAKKSAREKPVQQASDLDVDGDRRAFSTRLALYLAGVAAVATFTGALPLPAGRFRTLAVLNGGPLLLMLGALVCAVLVLVSVVVQGPGRRSDAVEYDAFRWLIVRLGLALAASSLLAHLYLGVRG
ncbi:hypothetical protein [Acidovorax sp. Root217]|uniref:hypothetical protein n=1 Tax=Acidovorax sp. Root217 TaxID=1736492 RepID=UPI000710CE0A|nr:hypothetical protein [Acidovorax sp. Root217]KRC26909.1 hypothetical protein ASE31_15770 [Acidovorax sp. Root217]